MLIGYDIEKAVMSKEADVLFGKASNMGEGLRAFVEVNSPYDYSFGINTTFRNGPQYGAVRSRSCKLQVMQKCYRVLSANRV